MPPCKGRRHADAAGGGRLGAEVSSGQDPQQAEGLARLGWLSEAVGPGWAGTRIREWL